MGLATDRLARTIDNLVNFATFEGGGHAVHREPFDLQALLKAVLEGERLKAKSRRIHLDVKVETLEQGFGDHRKLRQALSKLIDNAIKFGPHGSEILVRVSGDPTHLLFEVYDQGEGLVLDLGCGTGIVAVVLAKLLPADALVCASDLSPAAVALARRNAERNGIAVQCRSGSLFDPWQGQRFNLIVDDVAGVAEPLDRLSGWYPPGVPSAAGSDGTRWVLEILDQAPDFLAPSGLLIFPVLTLSREQLVTERARSRFAAVELVEEQWYPANEQLLEHLPLLEQMAMAGNARVEKRGSRSCWATRIYVAHRH